MQFATHRRRQAPTVIIVALIDVLIVLLIFLMATTSFNRQQPAIPLALPQSTQATKEGASDNAPLIISIDAKGNFRVGSDQGALTLDQLKTRLQTELEKRPEARVAVSADKDSPIGQFVKVWDVTKELKIKGGINLSAKEAAKP